MSLQPRTQSVRPMTNVKVASIRSDVIQNKNDGQTQDDVPKDSNGTYDQSCMDKASDVIQSQQKHDILNDNCDDNEEGKFEEKHVRKKKCFDFSEADLTNDLTVDENMMIDVLSLRRKINKNCDHCAESFDASIDGDILNAKLTNVPENDISAHVTKDRNTVRKKRSSPNTMKRSRVDIFGTAVDDTRNAALSSVMDTNTTAQANRKNTNTNLPADEVKHNISTQADGVFINTNAQADGVNLCTTAEAHGGIANTNAQAHREMPNKNAREHGVITNTNAREHQVVTNTNAREHQVVTNTQAQTDGVFTNPYAQADGVFGNEKAQADGVITNTNAPVDQAFINRNAQTAQVFTNKNAQSDQVFTGENAQADEVFTKTTAQADQVFTHLNAQADRVLANKTAQEDGVITNTNVQADETLTNPNARTNDTFTNPNAQVDDVFTNPNAQADEVLTNTNAQADAVFTCCPFSLPERLNTQAKKEHSNTNARAMEMDTNINSTVDFKFAALTDASARKNQETTCCENCRSHVVQCAIFIVSTTGMTICVALYCVIGAVVFTQLEGKSVTLESIPSIQMRICKRLQKEIPIPVDLNLTEKERECTNATNAVLENFGKRLTDIFSNPSFDQWGRTKWTFSGSLLFVVTVVTTIGYGTIAPVTAAGRVWTMMLGLLGIPITLLWVTNAGDYLAITTRFLYAQGFGRLCIGKGNSADSGDQHEVPVFVCLALIVSYLLLGAYLFHKWEGWTFEDSFYFCFMTLSTIGFGDFVPGFDDENMNDIETTQKQLVCMGYVLFGVALLAMVFQLMKDACWRAFHGCQQCCGCRTTDSIQDAELERAFQNAVKAQIALRLMLSVSTPVTNSSVSSRPWEGTNTNRNWNTTSGNESSDLLLRSETSCCFTDFGHIDAYGATRMLRTNEAVLPPRNEGRPRLTMHNALVNTAAGTSTGGCIQKAVSDEVCIAQNTRNVGGVSPVFEIDAAGPHRNEDPTVGFQAADYLLPHNNMKIAHAVNNLTTESKAALLPEKGRPACLTPLCMHPRVRLAACSRGLKIVRLSVKRCAETDKNTNADETTQSFINMLDTNKDFAEALSMTKLAQKPATAKPKETYRQRCYKAVAGILTFIMSTVGLSLVEAALCLGGASLFIKLEGSIQHQLSVYDVQNHTLQVLMGMVDIRDKTLSSENITWLQQTDNLLREFRENASSLILDPNYDKHGPSEWTFMKSLLFTVTVVTTIGYGNIVPITTEGRLVSMIFGFFGIPFTLLCLNNVGHYLARFMRFWYTQVLCRLCQGKKTIVNDGELPDVPPYVCMVMITSYLLLGAYIFNTWEGWSYLDAFYFCFTTLATIGFGDIVPDFESSSNTMGELAYKQTAYVVFLLIGLALVATSFELMKKSAIVLFKFIAETCRCRKKEDPDAALREYQETVDAEAERLMEVVTVLQKEKQTRKNSLPATKRKVSFARPSGVALSAFIICAEEEIATRQRAFQEQKAADVTMGDMERIRLATAIKEKEAFDRVRQEREDIERALVELEARDKAQEEKNDIERKRREKEAAEMALREKEALQNVRQETAALQKALLEKDKLELAMRNKDAVDLVRKEREALKIALSEKEALEKILQEKEALEKARHEQVALKRAQEEKEAMDKAEQEKKNLLKALQEKGDLENQLLVSTAAAVRRLSVAAERESSVAEKAESAAAAIKRYSAVARASGVFAVADMRQTSALADMKQYSAAAEMKRYSVMTEKPRELFDGAMEMQTSDAVDVRRVSIVPVTKKKRTSSVSMPVAGPGSVKFRDAPEIVKVGQKERSQFVDWWYNYDSAPSLWRWTFGNNQDPGSEV